MSAMSPYRRVGSPFWYVRRHIRGVGDLRLSTHTARQGLAVKYDRFVLDLRDMGRLDALRALKGERVTLPELYADRLPAQLDALLARIDSPVLAPLVAEWLRHGANDAGLRTRSMQRYASSWERYWELLPEGARVGDLTDGFVSEFKRHRMSHAAALGATLSPATLNRDLAALGAFLSWCAKEKGLKVHRPTMKYLRESKGKLRWLSREELTAFRDACPPAWAPLFMLLFGTGMTISEALGLRRADLDLRTRRVSIHEEYGRQLKRESRTRELSVPESLVPLLSAWLAIRPGAPDARIFPYTYWPARKAWNRVCETAGVYGATIHDARHTYAVHAVQGGLPEARLQKLLGHAHAGTTRRYAMHSPEQFLEQDADRIAEHMGLASAEPRRPLHIERRA